MPMASYRFAANGTCRGQKIVSTFNGNALLFQVLLGVIAAVGPATPVEHVCPAITPVSTQDASHVAKHGVAHRV